MVQEGKMNILITGGAGYIGSHVVKLLAEEHKVVVLDSLEHGHKKAVDKRAVFVKGNVGNGKLLDWVFRRHKIHAVIHFAGYINVGESVSDPYKYYENNLWNSMQLLKAMKDHEVKRIVFSSTAAVYGNPEKVPIPEDSLLRPINPYGSSKLAFEKILNEFGMDYVALRYFNAAGAAWGLGEDHRPENHLIPILLKKAMNDEMLLVNGNDYDTPDGTCVRDYVHVKDLAEAHEIALKKGSGAYNVGYGKGYSIMQVIDAASRVMKKKVLYQVGKRRPGDPDVLVAESKRIRKLGWKPKNDIRTIIKSAYEWHREHPEGYR
jgi:UDP-glucose 4-epimerase